MSVVASGLQGNGLGNDLGIGGRFTYTYSEYDDSEISTVSALEAEINWFAVDKAPDVFHGVARRCWDWQGLQNPWAKQVSGLV